MATLNGAVQSIIINGVTYPLPVVDTESSAVTSTNYNAAGVNLLYALGLRVSELENASLTVIVVDELPEEGNKKYLYLVPQTSGAVNDIYDEYVWALQTSSGTTYGWEKIGTTQATVITDYDDLENRPSLNNTLLTGNKTVAVSSTPAVTLTGSLNASTKALTITATATVSNTVTVS